MQLKRLGKSFALIGVIALSLAGCGDSDSDSTTTTTAMSEMSSTTSAADAPSTTAAGNAGSTSSTVGGVGTTVDVPISNFVFNPTTLTVKVGTTVRWTNKDSAVHTVTSGANRTSDGKFDKNLKTGETFSYTFTSAGTYEYYCRPHSNMNAKVIVEP